MAKVLVYQRHGNYNYRSFVARYAWHQCRRTRMQFLWSTNQVTDMSPNAKNIIFSYVIYVPHLMQSFGYSNCTTSIRNYTGIYFFQKDDNRMAEII